MPRARDPRHNRHKTCACEHARQLIPDVTAGTDEQDCGTAPAPEPAVPGARRPVPLRVPRRAVLYPPAGRGSLAGQDRGAWPDP